VPENNQQHPFLITHFSKNFAPPKNDALTEATNPTKNYLHRILQTQLAHQAARQIQK
jgi:hypothetical protein